MTNPANLTKYEQDQDYIFQWFMESVEEWQSEVEGSPTQKQQDNLWHIYGFARARMDELVKRAFSGRYKSIPSCYIAANNYANSISVLDLKRYQDAPEWHKRPEGTFRGYPFATQEPPEVDHLSEQSDTTIEG